MPRRFCENIIKGRYFLLFVYVMYMKWYKTLKKEYTLLSHKAQKNVLSFCLTVMGFTVLYSVFNQLHYLYTHTFFGYKLLISDGFVQFLPYFLFFTFIILYKKKIWDFAQNFDFHSVYFLLFLCFSIGFFLIPSKAFVGDNHIDLIFAEYLILLFANIFLFFAFFQKKFLSLFKNQIILILLLLIPFKLAPLLIDAFWQYSSLITMYGLKIFLAVFHIEHIMELKYYRVQIQDFNAYIGPSCAGIHSLLAFFVLYVTAILLGYDKGIRFYLPRVLIYLIFGLLCIFLLNSLRILLILLMGVYYSREFAINAFHENIGSLMLISFFVAYLFFVWKRIIKKNKNLV